MFSGRQTREDDDRFTWIQAVGYAVIAGLVVLWGMSFMNGTSGHTGTLPTAAVNTSSQPATTANTTGGGAVTLPSATSDSGASGGSAPASVPSGTDVASVPSAAPVPTVPAGSEALASGSDTAANTAPASGATHTSRHTSAAKNRITFTADRQVAASGGGTPQAVSAAVASSGADIKAATDGQSVPGAPAIAQTPAGSAALGSDSMAATDTTSTSTSTSSTDTTTTTTTTTTGSGGGSTPVGPDGTWIVPPVAGGVDQLGNSIPGLPGVATGPAPAGNVLALGSPGDQYAFDVTNRIWILAPTSGYKYVPGTGYVSTAGATPQAADPSTLPPIDTNAAPGPDGAWIVAPVGGGLDPQGNSLPALPGVAVGPAPAGNVLALGPDGSQYAFDVTTRTWILASNANATYKPGIGYVSTGS